ncbi:DUF6221 family protein [Streptomyces sp. NPDC048376]|uniref:DUF6221 family protein n=1 Tax=Streptomyces sp. NPDC048376 TaxID=3154926 RepID=UPI00344902B4
MSDIADFLRARYTEQRALAEATAEDAGKEWSPGDEHLSSSVNEAATGAAVVIGPWEYLDWGTRRHIAAHDPAAALADLDAKLAVVDLCSTFLHDDEGGTDPCAEGTLRLLAQPFVGHPDHKGEEWAP